MREQLSTGLGLLALAAAMLLAAAASVVQADTPAAKCNPVCMPPPEEEEPGEETPKPDPVNRVLVIGVGWDAEDPAMSSPLEPGRNGLYVDYLQGHFAEWMARSAAPFTVPGWRATSGGEYSIAPPPIPPLENGTRCKGPGAVTMTRAIGDRAEEKARQAGFNPDAYTYVVVQAKHVICVAGREEGRRILLVEPRHAMHEFGHALRLGHANDLLCFDANRRHVTLSNDCEEGDAFDPYDAMGAIADTSYNAIHTYYAGWLGGQFFDVRAGDFSQSWTIRPFTATPHAERALRLVDHDSVSGRDTTLWLEYRTELGIDHEDFTHAKFGPQQGLVAHLEPYPGGSQLLDMTPFSLEEAFDAPFRVGQTWANPLGEMKITLNSQSPAGATVTISSQRVTVPDVRGLDGAQAEARLAAAGLNGAGWGSVIDPTCAFIGTIASQAPLPGARVLAGSSVNLAFGARDPTRPCQ